jgi:tRNA dimethylallyltransferase
VPDKPVICLMGPTASGKTEFALRMTAVLPLDIISVDSALVYRGMDIGTAKPTADILREVPHGLVDILDPEDTYSAGDFVRDASNEIERIHRSGRVPLLVGGTMMYFRALTQGIAKLPEADKAIREAIDAEAGTLGWPAMHEQLEVIDPAAAARINRNDSQRIQRALEVFRASGRTLSEWQSAPAENKSDYSFIKIALVAGSRADLHSRIARRLRVMMDAGFVGEVADLMARPGLKPDHPSMRAVGYRQLWSHLAGEYGLEEAENKVLAATRQLCKRQLTWLRSEEDLHIVDPLDDGALDAILARLQSQLVS